LSLLPLVAAEKINLGHLLGGGLSAPAVVPSLSSIVADISTGSGADPRLYIPCGNEDELPAPLPLVQKA
jgi:hypothetical protein